MILAPTPRNITVHCDNLHFRHKSRTEIEEDGKILDLQLIQGFH